MRKVASLLAPLLMGCAELLASGTPGTPDGGAYCWRQDQTGRTACYPSQEQRDAAYQANEEGVRRAQAATLAAMALAEAQRQDAIRADQEQKAAAETEARQERQSKMAAFVAERDRKAAIKAEAAANVHALALDKEYAAPAISAIMCSIDDEVRGLRADLAHEKRVAAVGGVINLKARSEIATQLVDDSDELNGWNKALQRYGATRVPCKDVAGVEECRQNLDMCEGKTHDIAHVWDSELGTLWGSERPHPGR